MTATVRLADGRQFTRDQAERYLELLRERNRRREAHRLETQREEIVANCATLHGFIREFWYVLEPVAKFKSGWALEAMCAHLEAVTAGDIKRLLITVPPGMMKSLLLVFWTAWEWGPKGLPHIQVLSTSYSQNNAFRDNQKLRDLIESEKFQTLWPLAIRDDTNAIRKFANVKSGFSEARPFSKMTGGRANRVKIDDPHDTEAAESDVQRATAVRIMREAISDRVNDPVEDAIVMIMQRLHAKDCAATAIELGYVHLNLPMEYEAARRCATVLRPANDGNPAILFEDPRTEEGELLFPERFPAAAVAGLKKAKGAYAYAGQYQQRPSPRDGGLFKREWFAGKVIRQAPTGTLWVRHWDLAASKRSASARTAGVLMGVTPEGRYVVGHVITTQQEGNEVRKLIRATAEVDTHEIEISLPQDPGQAGKVQAQDMIAMLAGYVAHAEPETGDKLTRAEPFSVQCEAGNVYLVQGEWNTDYLDELCLFPNGSFKDQVDASSGAFGRLVMLSDGFDLHTYLKAYS